MNRLTECVGKDDNRSKTPTVTEHSEVANHAEKHLFLEGHDCRTHADVLRGCKGPTRVSDDGIIGRDKGNISRGCIADGVACTNKIGRDGVASVRKKIAIAVITLLWVWGLHAGIQDDVQAVTADVENVSFPAVTQDDTVDTATCAITAQDDFLDFECAPAFAVNLAHADNQGAYMEQDDVLSQGADMSLEANQGTDQEHQGANP
ncbi:hypothetical protein IV203_015037 [Nitzschia inconspicua]|uniref:Uncharacterized protein n=1 Tax=Nitzschia inconspicua TaxID=303405 RepID=A0A9K3LB46_9STRA|nr:hypothetical protein IV203_015037 [Nitzschia inconspicua]